MSFFKGLRGAVVTRHFCWRLSLSLLATSLLAPSSQADSLRGIYDLAVENDAKFKIAEAEYQARLEVEKQARSKLLPQVNADRIYGSTRTARNAAEVTTGTQGLTTIQQHTDQRVHDRRWELSMTQPVLDVTAVYGFKSGKSTTQQAEADLAYQQQELIVRVAEAYLSALQQREAVATSRAEITANEKQWKQAQARLAAGFAALADVEQARTEYELSIAKLAGDEGSYRAALEALRTISGQGHDNLNVLSEEFPVRNPDPADVQFWVDNALVRNNALSASRFAVKAAKDNALAGKLAHLPTVGIQLGYSDSDAHGSLDLDPYSPYSLPPEAEGWSKSGAISIRMPIYSGGYTSSKAREAHAQYYGELERRTDLERTVVENTRTLHIAVQTDVIRTKTQKQAINSAQSALEATRAGYTRGGIRSIVDVLQSQRIYFEATRDYATARLNYAMNLLRLKQMAGLLAPQDIHELDRWLVRSEEVMRGTVAE